MRSLECDTPTCNGSIECDTPACNGRIECDTPACNVERLSYAKHITEMAHSINHEISIAALWNASLKWYIPTRSWVGKKKSSVQFPCAISTLPMWSVQENVGLRPCVAACMAAAEFKASSFSCHCRFVLPAENRGAWGHCSCTSIPEAVIRRDSWGCFDPVVATSAVHTACQKQRSQWPRFLYVKIEAPPWHKSSDWM